MIACRLRSGIAFGLLGLLGLLLFGCSPQGDSGDSQTNWLEVCRDDAQCGGMKCLCGLCTRPCTDASQCTSDTACIAADEVGAVAQCSGSYPPAAGLCLPRCDDSACANGQICVAGVCTPAPIPTVNVIVDVNTQHQALVGFGASVAYGEGEITDHPMKAALYKAIFNDLGLDILRFRNRFEHAGDDDLSTAGQLYAAATSSLGHAPIAFLTTWSPPPALKANGALLCNGNPQTCTLSKTPQGGFDYPSFATYWQSSLNAYAAVGIAPDYIGLQNNPNWVPSVAELGEACRFLPEEGTTMVPVNGINVSVAYPGFKEAQAATFNALSSLPTRPKILAPETSDFGSIADYLPSLDPTKTDALAHQFYGVNPSAVDVAGLTAASQLETQYGRPVFVTEMQADGFGTALLIHYATVVEGASAFLQASLTGSVLGPAANTQALIGLDVSVFSLQDPYHAMRHFAAHTDPGWKRVEATADSGGLLSSAWLSPAGDALTVILINAGTVELSAHIALPDGWAQSEVTRSVFSGVERSAELGALSPQGVLRLPPEAVVTIALSH